MKRIHYAGGAFLTSDEIGDELLLYAAELANNDRSTTVEVPGLTEDGAPSTFTMVVGPASQILVGDEPGRRFDLDEEKTAAHLRRDRLRLQPPVVRPSAEASDDRQYDEL